LDAFGAKLPLIAQLQNQVQAVLIEDTVRRMMRPPAQANEPCISLCLKSFPPESQSGPTNAAPSTNQARIPRFGKS
jgi:hypothetical protein